MTFAHSAILHALWLLPLLLALRVWARAKSGLATQLFVAPRLRDRLVHQGVPWLSWLIFGLQLLALASLILAIAGPRYGEQKIPFKDQGRSILIAIDTSRSMNAVDVKPSRLERAKLAAEDLMLALASERVGLIAVAGRAYMQAPFTTDHDALVESIQAFDSYTVPVGGSKLSEGIKEALEICSKTAARQHCLIFFSDGGEKDPELDEALRKAKEKNIRIISIGIGTKVGSLIPDMESQIPNQYVIDPETQRAVHSTLNDELLKQMASATNGQYFNLGENMISQSFIQQILSTMDSIETGSKEITMPIDQFAWPLGAATLALIIALLLRSHFFLRPSMASLILLMLCLAPSAWAKPNYDLEAARKAYDLQDYAHAVEIYNYLLDHEASYPEVLNYGLGSALFKLGKQDRAAEALSKALQSDDPEMQKNAHHTLGNSLYEAGDKVLQSQPEYTYKAWMDALSHYDAALKIKDDTKIVENREELLSRIKKVDLKKQQQQQQDQSKEDSEKDQSGKEKKEDQKGQSKSKPSKDGQKSQDGQKSEDGESSDDKQSSKSEDQPSEKKDGKGSQEGSQGEKENSASNPSEPKDSNQPSEGKKSSEDKEEHGEQATAEALPEGTIQTNKQDKPQEEEPVIVESRDDKTGFGKTEARNLLRMYSEQIMQKQLQNEQAQRRRMRPGTKDW
jgi:Ca-activated chloride channel homolog